MYNYLRSFFIKQQNWQDLYSTIQHDIDYIKLKIITLDDLFYEQLTSKSMNDIDMVCNEIEKKIKTIQQTVIQIKNWHPQDNDDRILKNTRVFELTLELQKISNVYRTKQYDYLCKTTAL
jgi:hypothetical protein